MKKVYMKEHAIVFFQTIFLTCFFTFVFFMPLFLIENKADKKQKRIQDIHDHLKLFEQGYLIKKD